MYGNRITDSAMKYLQSDLVEAHKNNEKGIVFLLVICFLCFILNACMSTMTHFYLCKSHLIGVIKFFLQKLKDKNKEKDDKTDIPLVDINDDKKMSDDIKNITSKEKEEELLSERKQFFITLVCYVYVLFMAVSFDKIIILDSFNGSTVANYINIIAPSIFYFYFARGKKYYGEKLIALFNLLFGVALILLFFILSFY
jgi:amino acid permease